METRSRTEEDYVAAVSLAVRFAQSSLDETLTPGKLANVAGFSQHHFHRIFRAIVGESVMDFVRRLRLERAAYRLKSTPESVGGIAFDAGYGSQEAFARVFQAYFGLPPRDYRRSHAAHQLPSRCGVHYSAEGFTPLTRAVDPELLSSDNLCAAHRHWPAEFENGWEEMLSILTRFSTFVYSPPLGGPHRPLGNNTMTEIHTEIDREIEALEHDVEAAKQRLVEARRRRPKEKVDDYELKTSEGEPIRLSELFGDKDDLIMIHNMGTSCTSCTMWADGFSGLAPHLSDRAAFVVCSPDKPEVQKRFAQKRNWSFRMVSAHESPFFRDMGFWEEEGQFPGPWPGVSTFRRDADGQIFRVAKAYFNPMDDFCPVWPFLEMLEGGPEGWEPKYRYEEKEA